MVRQVAIRCMVRQGLLPLRVRWRDAYAEREREQKLNPMDWIPELIALNKQCKHMLNLINTMDFTATIWVQLFLRPWQLGCHLRRPVRPLLRKWARRGNLVPDSTGVPASRGRPVVRGMPALLCRPTFRARDI